MEEKTEFKCSYCGVQACDNDQNNKHPDYCPMPVSKTELDQARQIYGSNETVKSIFSASAKTEAEGYCKWTRIEEIINFAKHLDVDTIGIAHCIGLRKEAKAAHQIFKAAGFNVHSVCCKVGNINKEDLGLSDEDKVIPEDYESACNPIGQALVLGKAGCQLNVLVGLCVGHDSLFFMHSKVPTTVLVAKDRVLGHNPVAALYTSDSYYERLKKGKKE